jgi:hypothetical protein
MMFVSCVPAPSLRVSIEPCGNKGAILKLVLEQEGVNRCHSQQDFCISVSTAKPRSRPPSERT